MRALYDIDTELEQCLAIAEQQAIDNDGEIGEAIGEALESLTIERDKKIGGICRIYKNLSSEAAMIKAEEAKLAKRRKYVENEAERLKTFLSTFVKKDEKFSDSVSKIGWRKSQVVVIENFNLLPDAYINTVTTETPDKNGIKADLKLGIKIKGAKLEDNKNIQIK